MRPDIALLSTGGSNFDATTIRRRFFVSIPSQVMSMEDKSRDVLLFYLHLLIYYVVINSEFHSLFSLQIYPRFISLLFKLQFTKFMQVYKKDKFIL